MNLKTLRTEVARYPQYAVARKCGMTQSRLSQLETGVVFMSELDRDRLMCGYDRLGFNFDREIETIYIKQKKERRRIAVGVRDDLRIEVRVKQIK